MDSKRKLRHNEYYGTQEIFDELYSKSQEGQNFYKLVEIMQSDENIRLAYRNIKSNTGSKTKGTDGLTINDIKKLSIEKVVCKVRSMFQLYKPQAVRRVMIPKPGGGERPLGIPTMWDRIFQQCILQVLEPICEAKFYKHSYGFRPNRSTKHAVSRVVSLVNINDYYHCVDIDIKGFFDNVNHGKLLKQMWSLGIRDKKLLSIISALLKAEIQGVGIPEKGTPQGGILSPLLSNIVLNELDWWIANQWEEFPALSTKGPNKGKPYAAPHVKYKALRAKSNLKQIFIVRYADDFKIMCKTAKEAKKVFIAVKDFLHSRLKLECSDEKSQIVNIKKKHTEFLGVKLKATPKFSRTVDKKVKRDGKLIPNPKRTKTTKRQKKATGASNEYEMQWTVSSHMKEKAISNAISKIKTAIVEVQKNPTRNTVHNLNSVIHGIQNYYSMATLITLDLARINFNCLFTLKNRLKHLWTDAKKSDLDRHQAERFTEYNWNMKKIQRKVISPIYAQKHVTLLNLNQDICNFTAAGRELIHKHLNIIDHKILNRIMRMYIPSRSIEYNDNRISKFVAQHGRCAITKTPLGVHGWECHHMNPYRNSQDDSFSNLIVLEEKIHKLIRMTDTNKILRVIREFNLDQKQLAQVNELRKLEGMKSITL